MTNRVDVAVGVIVRDEQVLIAQRAKHLHQGNKWEFPGGKVEPDESSDLAVRRELEEELNIQVTALRTWFSLSFDYPDKQVNLHMFVVTDFSGEPIGNEGQPLKWVPFSALDNYTFPDANTVIIEKLQSGDF